jgi:hypothetical protein
MFFIVTVEVLLVGNYCKPDMVVNICNPIIQETEAGRSWVLGHSEFQDIVGYIARPYLKKGGGVGYGGLSL